MNRSRNGSRGGSESLFRGLSDSQRGRDSEVVLVTDSRGDRPAHLGRESAAGSQSHGRVGAGRDSRCECGSGSLGGLRGRVPGEMHAVLLRPCRRSGGSGCLRTVPGFRQDRGPEPAGVRYFGPVATGSSAASDHSLKLPS